MTLHDIKAGRQRGKTKHRTRADTNEKEMKEMIVKINETKICFFEKISKIDKSLARLIKKKKREKSNQKN